MEEEKKINAEDLNNLKARLSVSSGSFWKKVRTWSASLSGFIMIFQGAITTASIDIPSWLTKALMFIAALGTGIAAATFLGVDANKVDPNNNQ